MTGETPSPNGRVWAYEAPGRLRGYTEDEYVDRELAETRAQFDAGLLKRDLSLERRLAATERYARQRWRDVRDGLCVSL